MNVRYFLFLTVGIERTYIPANPEDDTLPRFVSEPSGSIICRRNILALASILVIAGLANLDLHDLTVFGLTLSRGKGDFVLGAAAIFAQLYWYVLRYHHLTAEGKVPDPDNEYRKASVMEPIAPRKRLGRKTSDLLANRLAFVLTLGSWYFIARWICGPEA